MNNRKKHCFNLVDYNSGLFFTCKIKHLANWQAVQTYVGFAFLLADLPCL